jgi:hypothetical protein
VRNSISIAHFNFVRFQGIYELGSPLAQSFQRIALPAKIVGVDEGAVAGVTAGRAILHGVGVC